MHWLDVIAVAVWLAYVWYSWGKDIYTVVAEAVVWLLVAGGLWQGFEPIEHFLVRNLGIGLESAAVASAAGLTVVIGLGGYAGLKWFASRLTGKHLTWFWHIIFGLVPSIVAGGLIVMVLAVVMVLIFGKQPEGLYVDSSWFYHNAGEVIDLWRK